MDHLQISEHTRAGGRKRGGLLPLGWPGTRPDGPGERTGERGHLFEFGSNLSGCRRRRHHRASNHQAMGL